MSKKNTLEEAYFHICNGGLTLKVVERVDARKNDVYEKRPTSIKGVADPDLKKIGEQKLVNRRWYMEVQLNTYGSGVSFKFPLVPIIVDWLIPALTRVREEMSIVRSEPTDGIEHGFERTQTARIKAERGGKRDHDWPHAWERSMVSSGSNEQKLVPVNETATATV